MYRMLILRNDDRVYTANEYVCILSSKISDTVYNVVANQPRYYTSVVDPFSVVISLKVTVLAILKRAV